MKRDSAKNHDEAHKKKKKEQREKTIFRFLIILIIIIILCLFFRSCRARDKPAPESNRIYEENCTPEKEASVPAEDTAKRLNLAVAKEYHISDEEPLFYINYPEDNVYDVVFTLKDRKGSELYQTAYIVPGTNAAVDGTAFLEKGEHEINCVAGIYSRDSGRLLSDCTTIVLNICYE